MQRFTSPGHARYFLAVYGLIASYCQPQRHLLAVPKYRQEMAQGSGSRASSGESTKNLGEVRAGRQEDRLASGYVGIGGLGEASGPSTSMAYRPFRGHARAGGNPVPLPASLEARLRGHDPAASGKGSLWSTTKWIDH
jgi:hypothetical protein